MKSLKDYLPRNYLTEVWGGTSAADTDSPISGNQSDAWPDPTMTRNGKRELKIGDPVVVGDDKGAVDNFEQDGKISVRFNNSGIIKAFPEEEVDYDPYYEEHDEELDAARALQNLKTLAGIDVQPSVNPMDNKIEKPDAPALPS